MNVQLVYRNYKPLHDLYRSFLIEPPPLVSFEIPRPMARTRRLYPLYLAIGDWNAARSVIAATQDLLFGRMLAADRADVIHLIQMVPRRMLNKPYVIDFEHAAALANFVRLDTAAKKRVADFLLHENCRTIIPLTRAAEGSLSAVFPELYPRIRRKLEVIYPALPDHTKPTGDGVEACVAGRRGRETLRFLFVGNDVYRKGLHELLIAFREIEAQHPDIELDVVSDAPPALKQAFASPRIRHYDPVYSFAEMIETFYRACDVLVLPTHCDTFGMVILNALSCGTPVVTTDQFAARELVRDGENGLLVRSKRLLLNEVCAPDRAATRAFNSRDIDALLVRDLVETLRRLCADRDTLGRMSREAVKDFEAGGKFSIGERNRKLAAVYAGCMDDYGCSTR